MDHWSCHNPLAVKIVLPHRFAKYAPRISRIFLSKQLFLLKLFSHGGDYLSYQFGIWDVQMYLCPVDLHRRKSDRRAWKWIVPRKRARLVFESAQRNERNEPKPEEKKPKPKPEEKKPKPDKKTPRPRREGSREPREPRGPNAKEVISSLFRVCVV